GLSLRAPKRAEHHRETEAQRRDLQAEIGEVLDGERQRAAPRAGGGTGAPHAEPPRPKQPTESEQRRDADRDAPFDEPLRREALDVGVDDAAERALVGRKHALEGAAPDAEPGEVA